MFPFPTLTQQQQFFFLHCVIIRMFGHFCGTNNWDTCKALTVNLNTFRPIYIYTSIWCVKVEEEEKKLDVMQYGFFCVVVCFFCLMAENFSFRSYSYTVDD